MAKSFCPNCKNLCSYNPECARAACPECEKIFIPEIAVKCPHCHGQGGGCWLCNGFLYTDPISAREYRTSFPDAI